jgi:hypothetical protein
MAAIKYQVIFDHIEAAAQDNAERSVPAQEYGEYAEIAELSRLAEAIKEPDPLSPNLWWVGVPRLKPWAISEARATAGAEADAGILRCAKNDRGVGRSRFPSGMTNQ